ncbi:MAG TPA: lipid A deacylase LpxR family protein, partial [Acetobacteraceae bacterium]|nr:lipid A deacylase LpxR family protein [Acetobacteraceae bacterium]
ISSSKLTDRYYVNGLLLGYVSPTGELPDFASRIGTDLWGDGRQRISIDIEQSIFTPANTTAKPPLSTDRPYAGVLTGTFTLYQDTDFWRSMLGFQVGLVGPGAGAEELQNSFHSLIGQGKTLGWNYYQIHNEPVVQLFSQRVWREELGHIGGVDVDWLPNFSVGVGNLRIYGLTGALVRFGQGLDSDYGPNRIQPWGMTGGEAYTPTRPFDWYFFAGADGQAVLYDVTLNGNLFQSSPHVSPVWDVGELEAGVALMVHGVRISYTQVLQTSEFRHQKGGLHQFGSLAASLRF